MRGGWITFFFCLALAALLFLPYVIADHGYFLYYGDFNVQQIPFYQLAHDAIRSGETGWSWNTDLGANFWGSYSFYLLGSPFFWLTLPFPGKAVPYLMAPLLVLKFACTGVTAYVWLKTMVQKTESAVLGGILYAFCGFNLYNVFFNHFLEPVLVFPLLLWALDEAVLRKKGGVLALAVAASAVVNYYFFFGQAVFLLLYYLFNLWGGRYPFCWKTLLRLAAESVLGVLLSAFLLVPSLLAILGNDRLENVYLGMRMLFYNNEQRYGLLAESLFLLPDVPAQANLFSDSNAKWASVSLYLPLFTVTGAAVYFKMRQKTWLKRLLCCCGIMALVPVLNSTFSAMNANYYARWFYMPTLLLVLCTLEVLEQPTWDWGFGIRFAAVGCGIFALIALLPSEQEDGSVQWLKLPKDPALFWESMTLAVVSLLLLCLLRSLPSKRHRLRRCLGAGSLAVVILLSGHILFLNGRSLAPVQVYDEIVTEGLEAAPFEAAEERFYRVDFDGDAPDNLGMFWKLPTIQCFHSIVPPSVMAFYESIGVDRDVASRPDTTHIGLRGLTSVKYRMVPESGDAEAGLPGFSYLDTQNGYLVFENRLFVPMGFTYDYYVDDSQWEACTVENRENLLLKALYLDGETEAKAGGLLPKLPFSETPTGTEEEYAENCLERAAHAADTFTVTKEGFTSTITLDRENLVFYSVPYDEGWQATVNGEPAEIYKVNVGFLAVRGFAGENEIVFTYETPGKALGRTLSLAALAVLAGYGAWMRLWRKKKEAGNKG